jgi:hypothetical protein
MDRLTRRHFIEASGGALLGLALGCNKPANKSLSTVETSTPVPTPTLPQPNEDYYIQEAEKVTPIEFGPQVITQRTNSRLDPNYLEGLIAEFQKDTSTREARAHQVVTNLSIIRTNDGAGTALKIDESGYYLTAAHLLHDNSRKPISKYSIAYDLPSGLTTPIQEFVVTDNYIYDDIALFYAPRALPRKPTRGISLNFSSPEENEDLWMHALTFLSETKGFRLILHGKVDSSLPGPTARINEELIEREGFVGIRGMIPLGGTSGSPIIDAQGKLRGVEAAFSRVTGAENKLENYLGASMTPLDTIHKLIDKAKKHEVFTLPTNN